VSSEKKRSKIVLPKPVGENALAQVGLLGSQGGVKDKLGEGTLGLDTGEDLVVDAVPQTGHRGEEGGLENG